jgi:hypothetical protein
MYENWRTCTPDDLEREITMPAEKDDQDYAQVKTNGLVWSTIVKFVNKGIFAAYEQEILHADAQVEANPLAMQVMTVPVEMAVKVRDYLAEPLKDIDKAFMNMGKIQGRFSRMDGEPWDSHSSLIGEALSVGDDEGEFAAHQMTTPYSAFVKVEMEYVLHGE